MLRAESLSQTNLVAGLRLADRCFMQPSDQNFLRTHWQRVIDNRCQYFCPDDNAELTLLDHFLFFAGKSALGFGGLYRHHNSPSKEWLNWFGVDPECRSKGHGAQIIFHLANIAKARGAAKLVGYTEDSDENTPTKNFYQRLGFRPTTSYLFRSESVLLYELELAERE